MCCPVRPGASAAARSEEHTSELQSLAYLVCRLRLEKKNEIVEEQNVPPRSPDGLCQVSAHLIPRQTVRENHRAVWTWAARNVEPRVQFGAVTRHDKLGKPRREFLIGWSICYDSRRCLLRPRMRRCPQDPEQSDNDHPLPQ